MTTGCVGSMASTHVRPRCTALHICRDCISRAQPSLPVVGIIVNIGWDMMGSVCSR